MLCMSVFLRCSSTVMPKSDLKIPFVPLPVKESLLFMIQILKLYHGV